MRIDDPSDVIRRWADQVAAGDIDGLAPLYDPDVALATGNGADVVRGVPAVLEAWRSFSGATFVVECAVAFVSGDTAMTHNRCRVTLPTGDVIEGVGVEVLRRDPDAGWLYLICNPYGTTLVSS
jgi:ketosteroid isomerase-like protein